MNADHVDGMILLAGTHSGIEGSEAATSVDRLGSSLRLKTNNRVKGARTNFFHATPQGTQAVLAERCVKRRHEADTRVHLLSLQLLKPPPATRLWILLDSRVGRLKLRLCHAQVVPDLKQLLCNPGKLAERPFLRL
jgi:hypothetical protein